MKFRSNGKLMLTGEYLVLKGAKAFSLPLRYGQELEVIKQKGIRQLSWSTNVNGTHWFDAKFSIPEFAIANTNDFPTAQNLREILLAARSLNPFFLTEELSYFVNSNIGFDINWGLGSSSSLLVNIASWAEIDPFSLHFLCSNGSGYDIASSMTNQPVIYQLLEKKPIIRKIDFNPGFKDHLYFLYLGNKRKSIDAVNEFESSSVDYTNEINEINTITEEISHTQSYNEFKKAINQHENIISKLLKTPEVGKTRFFDFKGSVKSLGAWGGDFVMLMTEQSADYVTSYLKRKDYKYWFRYNDLVLNNNEIYKNA